MEPRPAPPAPAGLVAEVTLRDPAALYASLRGLLPGRGERAPSQPALAFAAAGNLPLAAANALVLDRPCHGALVSASATQVGAALACRVRSGNELVRALSAGGNAERRATTDRATGLTVLVSSSAPPLGVVDDFLIVASDEPTLRALGPYVARALPPRAPPIEAFVLEVPAPALRGPFAAVLRSRWQNARNGLATLAKQAAAAEGRPPDFGDPDLILALVHERVADLLDLLESSDRLRVAFDVGATGLELRFTLTPTAGGRADAATRALVVGSLRPLLSLPRATVGAGFFHFTAADCHCGDGQLDGAGNAAPNAPSAGPLEAAKKALGRSFSGVLEASEGATVVGLGLERALVVRRETRTSTAGELALGALFRAAREPSLGRALEPVLGKVFVREESATVPGLTAPVRRAELTVPGLGLNRAEFAWKAHGDALWLAAGGDAMKVLAAAATAPETERLGSNPAVRPLLQRHEPAAFAVLVNSGALTTGAPEPPSLLSFTRRDESALLELDMARADAERLVKVFVQ